MKKSIVLMLFIGLMACGQEKDTATKTNTEIATPVKTEESPEDLEKKGLIAYQKSPAKALPIFKELIGKYEQKNNIIKASFSALSVASIYDVNLNRTDSALIFANRSLEMWKNAKDSTQVANLLKYVGLLEGKLGQHDAATQHIDEAIALYEKLNFPDGIAVSNLNLAEIHFKKNDLKKGKMYLDKSTNYWRKGYQKDKIFSNNLYAIEWYDNAGDSKMVKKLINENTALSKEITLNTYLDAKFNKVLEKYK